MITLQLASAAQEKVPVPQMCGSDPCNDSKRSFSIAIAGYFPLKILFPPGVAVNVCLSHSRVLQDNDLRAVKRHSLEGLLLLKHLYVQVLSSSWQAERPRRAHCWRRQWLTLPLGPLLFPPHESVLYSSRFRQHSQQNRVSWCCNSGQWDDAHGDVVQLSFPQT